MLLRLLDCAYLQTITALCLLPHNIQYRVYQLSPLGVVALGPVVPSSTLSEDEVVWSEDLTEWTRADRVHGAWLQVDQHGSGYIFASGSFVVVDVDSLQLQVGVTVVCASWVDSMFIGDHLPELLENSRK